MRLVMEDDIQSSDFTLFGYNNVLDLLEKANYSNIWVYMPKSKRQIPIKIKNKRTRYWNDIIRVFNNFSNEDMALSKLKRIYVNSKRSELGLVF